MTFILHALAVALLVFLALVVLAITAGFLACHFDLQLHRRRIRPATAQARADLDVCEAIGALPTVTPAHEEH